MSLKIFFDEIRPLFGKRLKKSQVDGMEMMIRIWQERYAHYGDDVLAYIMASVFHETGGRMQPVREGFTKTNASAVRAVTRLYNKGKIRVNYALPHPTTGKNYYGRGDIQTTWYDNYLKISELLGIDAVSNPDLLLKPGYSKAAAFEGMLKGVYGPAVTKFINQDKCDFVNARRSVNGVDQAHKIAGYAEDFQAAITAAGGVKAMKVINRKKMLDDLDKAGSRTAKAIKSNKDLETGLKVLFGAGSLYEFLNLIQEFLGLGAQARAAIEAAVELLRWGLAHAWVFAAAGLFVLAWNNRALLIARTDDEEDIGRLNENATGATAGGSKDA